MAGLHKNVNLTTLGCCSHRRALRMAARAACAVELAVNVFQYLLLGLIHIQSARR